MDNQHVTPVRLSWFVTMRREWYIWFPIALAIYLFINGYYSNWTSWLVPNTTIPLLYIADALFIAPYMQRQLEGDWYFENIRSGYPFVSTLYDFPSTLADMSIIELMQWAWPSWVEAYHWLHTLSYVLVFVVTYVVFRYWQIQPVWAVIGAIAFDFMPFHHERIPHPYFFWYFIVPIVYIYAWKLWQGELLLAKRWSTIAHLLLFAAIGTFYVYWAVMSSAVLVAAGAVGSAVRRDWRVFAQSMIFIFCMVAGLFVSYVPSLRFAQENPTNMPLVREVEDSEKYALWPVALVTPAPTYTSLGRAYHRFLDGINFPAEHNVNTFLGTIGLMTALSALALYLLGYNTSPFLRFLAVIALGLTLYAAVGGLGLTVSLYVTSLIRATNRIFIFIAFAGIAASIYAVQYVHRTYGVHRPLISGIVGLAIVLSVWFDAPMSIGAYQKSTWQQRITAWQRDSRFFVETERLLGTGAAIYQLPALFFPEGDLDPVYGQMRCYLYTSMYCSHGNVFGRDGYLFYRELQNAPVRTQLDVIARLGFDGIIISRSYYRNNPLLEQDIAAQLGAPLLLNDDQTLALYRVVPTGPKIPGRSLAQIVDQSQFLQAEYQIRQQTAMTTPIAFWHPWLPGSVRYVRGLYDPEPRGRWNDGKSARWVTIAFNEPLPSKFRIDVTALAWGRSVGAPVQVRLGSTSTELRFTHTLTTQTATFTNASSESQLIFVPPFRERVSDKDYRYLSFLLHQITITPLP